MTRPLSRREFLQRAAAPATCALLFDRGPDLREALPWPLIWPQIEPEFFTPEQLLLLGAAADRILPPGNGVPGAAALGPARFIDRSVARIFPEDGRIFLVGLSTIERKAAEVQGSSGSFLDLEADGRDAVLRALVEEDFFPVLRGYTVYSCFTLPEHGGNAGEAGWELIGFENRSVHTPPFGAYDVGYAPPMVPDPAPGVVPPPPQSSTRARRGSVASGGPSRAA